MGADFGLADTGEGPEAGGAACGELEMGAEAGGGNTAEVGARSAPVRPD